MTPLRIFSGVINYSIVMLFGCSCATQEWTTIQIREKYETRVREVCQDLMDKGCTAEQNTKETISEAKRKSGMILEATRSYRVMTEMAGKHVETIKNLELSYAQAMNDIKKNALLRIQQWNQATQKKIDETLLPMSRQKQEWIQYTTDTEKHADMLYAGFGKRGEDILFKLSILPISKTCHNPLSSSVKAFLDADPDEITGKLNSMKQDSASLGGDMTQQEQLFVYDALLSCRYSSAVAGGGKNGVISNSPWDNEGHLILAVRENKFQIQNEQKPLFFTLLLNRCFVCDVQIRTLKSSQDSPLELAYFIYHLSVSNSLMEDNVWKRRIDVLCKSYISKFNSRLPISQE